MNKEYRTEEQFMDIIESAYNGQWRQAFKQACEGGFYGNDLIRFYESLQEVLNIEVTDLILIAEGAQKLRG